MINNCQLLFSNTLKSQGSLLFLCVLQVYMCACTYLNTQQNIKNRINIVGSICKSLVN